MDYSYLKIFVIFLGLQFLATAQRMRPSSTRHRRPPSVIITRDNLSAKPSFYGIRGSTAAEFVVSAGLDTSKNSAVRIRRIGGHRNNSPSTNRQQDSNAISNAAPARVPYNGETHIKRHDLNHRGYHENPGLHQGFSAHRTSSVQNRNTPQIETESQMKHIRPDFIRDRPSYRNPGLNPSVHAYRTPDVYQSTSDKRSPEYPINTQRNPDVNQPQLEHIPSNMDPPINRNSDLNRVNHEHKLPLYAYRTPESTEHGHKYSSSHSRVQEQNSDLNPGKLEHKSTNSNPPLNLYRTPDVRQKAPEHKPLSLGSQTQVHRGNPGRDNVAEMHPPIHAYRTPETIESQSDIKSKVSDSKPSRHEYRPTNLSHVNSKTTDVNNKKSEYWDPNLYYFYKNLNQQNSQKRPASNQNTDHYSLTEKQHLKNSGAYDQYRTPASEQNTHSRNDQQHREVSHKEGHQSYKSPNQSNRFYLATQSNQNNLSNQDQESRNYKSPDLPHRKQFDISENPTYGSEPNNGRDHFHYQNRASDKSSQTSHGATENTNASNKKEHNIISTHSDNNANLSSQSRRNDLDRYHPGSVAEDKNIIAETPPLQLNNVGFRHKIIRKPGIILRDQVTVREANQTSGQRFGPRAVRLRKKRQLSFNRDYFVSDGEKEREDDEKVEIPGEIKATSDQNPANIDIISYGMSEIKINSQHVSSDYTQRRKGRNMEFYNESPENATQNEQKSVKDEHLEENHKLGNVSVPLQTESLNTNPQPYALPFKYEDSSDEEAISFSDFLTSPLAEKLGLQRQKDPNSSDPSERLQNSDYNTTLMLLRRIIAAQLVQSILDHRNGTNSSTDDDTTSRESTGDWISPSEQRQYSYMVHPYQGMESAPPRAKSKVPVIRILKGKIISLPDLPPELIPIILGTYKPTHMNQQEDPKLAEEILENAILTLLQNEDLLNIRPLVATKVRIPNPGDNEDHMNIRPMLATKIHIANRGNRKSPSQKYVGSLKSTEPIRNTNYRPNELRQEWGLGPRCDRLTEEICLDDSDYPSSAIMSSIYKDKSRFDLMYAEVKERESQVEGLSRKQELAYSFDHYYGLYPQSSGGNVMPRDYAQQGGFVCPSEVHYGRPHRAKNRRGEWKVVVNVGEYTQTIRMEKCLASGNPCQYVINHMESTCSQVYSYHRLLVFNKEQGLHIDAFRVPTACTCYLREQGNKYESAFGQQMEEYGGLVESAPTSEVFMENASGEKNSPNSFSTTLWAILGGGQHASALAQQPQFLGEVQKQIGWTQQLQQYPQLLKHISPDQVLKQLLEEDDDDEGIRRQLIKLKFSGDQPLTGGYASHPVSVAVPIPLNMLPPNLEKIHRRPITSSVEHKHMYPRPNQVIALPPPERTNVFSLTKDNPQVGMRPFRSNVMRFQNFKGHRNVYALPPLRKINGHRKIQPGMYMPSSAKLMAPESSLVPISPQFTDSSITADARKAVVMKPMPVPKGSKTSVLPDEDLMAVEKSESDDHGVFDLESSKTENKPNSDDNDSKINFSYHPILEYLNMQS